MEQTVNHALIIFRLHLTEINLIMTDSIHLIVILIILEFVMFYSNLLKQPINYLHWP